MKHSELKATALRRKGVKIAYNALESEYALIRESLKTQQQIESGQSKTECPKTHPSVPAKTETLAVASLQDRPSN